MSEGLSEHVGGSCIGPQVRLNVKRGHKKLAGKRRLETGLAAHCKATGSEGGTGSPALKEVPIEPSCAVGQLQRFASPVGLELYICLALGWGQGQGQKGF